MSTSARPSVTAIVAATLSNGIGKDGGLPWRLPGEMKYFQKVTVGAHPSAQGGAASTQNAVIMGRKTWESIPTKFRPLANRQNLVVSRKGIDVSSEPSSSSHSSLSEALSSPSSSASQKIFLIGGAQLYSEALTASPPMVDRVLLTRITTDVECDTFLDDFTSRTAENGEEGREGKKVWRIASHKELEEYVGFEVKEGEVEEKEFKYRFEMWVLA